MDAVRADVEKLVEKELKSNFRCSGQTMRVQR